jgi:CubicO group peptidase (beta-lactamase class C family)
VNRSDALDEVQALLDDAVARGVTPGAAARIDRLDGASFRFFAGERGLAPTNTPVDEHTIYDLASLTKLLSTTWLCARAVRDGVVSLDECPWPVWPNVRVRDVLAHRAGLPAWLPLYEDAAAHRVLGLVEGRMRVESKARAVVAEHAPDTRTIYSDVGFIALGALVEKRIGERLDRAFRELTPAHARGGARFLPIFEQGYVTPLSRVAPTERCSLRGRIVHGQVHDENAYAMGGIAGHAGLFGTVDDTALLALELLRALIDDAHRDHAVLRAFADTPGERPLGFDRATLDGSTGGALSEHAVGHLGFTGTSLWIDRAHPRGPATFVLLTNRVHPSRENNGIRELRPRFHRAAARLLERTTMT